MYKSKVKHIWLATSPICYCLHKGSVLKRSSHFKYNQNTANAIPLHGDTHHSSILLGKVNNNIPHLLASTPYTLF